jgi:type I restriction enzyme S subunit
MQAIAKENGFRDYVGTATIPHLTGIKLASIRIPVPPLPLQNEFAERVTEIRELEAKQSASRERLDALFQSMLHRAFRGEL